MTAHREAARHPGTEPGVQADSSVVHRRPSDRLARLRGEDEAVRAVRAVRAGRAGRQMGRQRVQDDLGEGDGQVGRRRLRRREKRLSVRDDAELPVHGDLAAQDVDPVDGEAEHRSLTHAGASGPDEQGRTAVPDRPLPGCPVTGPGSVTGLSRRGALAPSRE